MSELRMYVEHLFEGKVLTPEMIELKEEIYGNLVARYEDYVAGGMSAEDAIEKTKASMTSLDDVLEAGQDSQPVAETVEMPVADSAVEGTESARAEGSPQPPVQQGAETAPARKHLSPAVIAVIVVAALFVIVILGFMGCNMFVADRAHELYENNQTVSSVDQTTGNGTGQGTSAGDQQGAQDQGQGASGQATPTFSDPEDQAEYEATVAVDDAIANQDVAVLQQAVGNGTDTAAFVAELPLGAYLGSAGAPEAQTSFAISYENVSDLIDGDAIERALLYNAVTLMSVYPALDRVDFTVQEEYDSVYDADRYAFDRSTLEHAFSSASNGAIAQLNSSLFESAEAWDQVRDYVFRENFRERQVEFAEVDR